MAEAANRRRGPALEVALLDAAWQELLSVGYGRFTIEGVATRAGTSRPVLYRRWPNRSDLAIAAIRHRGLRQVVEIPDTGSVRDDLVEMMRRASAGRTELAVLFSMHMGEFFSETGRTLADLRAELLRSRPQPWGVDRIIQRGIERGEIDPDRITPRIASLPTDLLRHEMLMTLQAVPDETIEDIIDGVFMPLARVQGAKS
jgi:AcrR family transcriptional regulator